MTYFVCDLKTCIIKWYVYSIHSFSALPEHQTLEHLVGHAEPRIPEDQPQVEAARLPRVVAVILQEGGLPVVQHVKQHRDLHQVDSAAGTNKVLFVV